MSVEYEKIAEAFGWIDKAIDYLRCYKPETKSMAINYRTRDAEIELVLYIPDNLKRKLRKVEIPAYQNFVIDEMRDESFTKIGELWQFKDNKWILDPTKLPRSERYLLTLKGKLSNDILTRLVYVQPAANKDRTEDIDRYWLRSMIRSVESIEKLWDALNVDEVSARVRIGIERYLSTTIPKELNRRIDVTRKWIHVGRSRDRQRLYKVWGEMRHMYKTNISVDEIIDLIYKLTDGSFFSQFVLVDEPYMLGDIRREETFKGTFPERMQVIACTCLTLKQPIAAGDLTFKKKEYTKTIEEKFSDVV